MSTSANPLAAFQQFAAQQKAAAPQQGGSLDDYLAARAKQYGATPGGGTEWTGGTVLDNPFAGLKDFGKKSVTMGGGEGEGSTYDQEVSKTAGDILGEKFGARLGHKSTFTKAYKKDGKGNSVEVDVNSLTPEELNSGNVVLYMGGATGGRNRERMAQAYIPQGDKLIPVGDPSYYKGEHPDAKNVATALKVASIASLPFGGVGGLFGNVTGGIAGGIASLGIPQMAANIGANALVSGVTQGGISKLMGGDFSKGFKSGAISGGIGAGMNALAPDMFKGLGSLATPAKSLATQALTSAALGRKFDPAAAIKGAAINYGLGQGLQTAGVDPKAFNTFMQFAGPALMQKRRPGGR